MKTILRYLRKKYNLKNKQIKQVLNKQHIHILLGRIEDCNEIVVNIMAYNILRMELLGLYRYDELFDKVRCSLNSKYNGRMELKLLSLLKKAEILYTRKNDLNLDKHMFYNIFFRVTFDAFYQRYEYILV